MNIFNYEHKKVVCTCGTLITECKCLDCDKRVITIERGCQNCNYDYSVRQSRRRDGSFWEIYSSNKNETLTLSKENMEHIISVFHNYYHGED